MNKMEAILRPDGEKSNTKKTVALSLATMFNSVLSLVMSMALARVLTKGDLAAYQQTSMVLTTAFPFLQMGIPQGIFYVLSRNKGRERAVINEAMFCVSAAGALFAAFLILGGNNLFAGWFKNAEISTYLLYIIPTLIFQLLTTVCGTVMVYVNRVSFHAKFQVFTSLFRIAITILTIILLRTVLRTLQVSMVMQVITGLATFLIVYLYLVPHDDGRMRLDSIGKLLKISIPLGVAGMIVTLNSFLDKWVVSFMCSPEDYAVFTAGAHEVPLITAITNSVMTVIIVSLTEAFRDEDHPKALGIINGAAKKTSLFLMPIMMLCLALAKPLVCFIFTDEYAGAVNIFIVYLLYMPYWTIYYGPIMTAMGKPKAVMYCALAGLVCNGAISVFCVKLFGMIGASIATIATIYLVNLPLNLGVICKKINVKWTQLLPVKHYGICILLSVPGAAVSFAISMLTEGMGYFWQLAFGGIAFVAVTAPIFIKHFELPWKDYVKKFAAKFSH